MYLAADYPVITGDKLEEYDGVSLRTIQCHSRFSRRLLAILYTNAQIVCSSSSVSQPDMDVHLHKSLLSSIAQASNGLAAN